MPHFGIMDEDTLSKKDAAFTRTRLHIRSARRRLREGKMAHGIVTYWDALIYGLRWYYYEHKDSMPVHDEMEIYNPETLFPLIIKSGLQLNFEFEYWEQVAEQAIDGPISDFTEPEQMIDAFTVLFEQIGIEPFDETTLPDEMEGLY
ncbi:MAG: hypothetical protein INQ03_05340 [Candidatus Heimdallarchaeota archaeon]|nr:hypothetical protein [Candidatus Heimdallarchaeota archaeon]